jgi:hypothetical protein
MLSEIILAFLIGALVIDRYLYSREMNKQLMELAKLVKSKDSIEYATSQSMEKPKEEEIEKESSPIDLSTASDQDFYESIAKQNANIERSNAGQE